MGIFGVLFIGGSMVLGLLLAILLDQKIRAEGVLRTVYLYPMAISFIVTGTAWKWILNPGLGIEHLVQSWGFPNFQFDWLVDDKHAIYCVVIAGIWQASGFVMALFLAGLRGIDDSIIKAAQIDGASLPRIYWRIVVPSLRPVFFSTLMVVSPPVDQELRPGDRADLRRPGLLHRPAGHVHVRDVVLARPGGAGRRQRHDHAVPRWRPSSCPTCIRN